MNTSNGRFYHEVTGGSWEECDPSGLQQVVQDGSFCGNDGSNVGGRFSETV